jgi:hypothetical protein
MAWDASPIFVTEIPFVEIEGSQAFPQTSPPQYQN